MLSMLLQLQLPQPLSISFLDDARPTLIQPGLRQE
jgi:hypothetical protein